MTRRLHATRIQHKASRRSLNLVTHNFPTGATTLFNPNFKKTDILPSFQKEMYKWGSEN